jgi:hypothetical protein
MHIDGGPMLMLHPENARDLMLAQGDGTRVIATADAVCVPARLTNWACQRRPRSAHRLQNRREPPTIELTASHLSGSRRPKTSATFHCWSSSVP